jgi:hypothetical protein
VTPDAQEPSGEQTELRPTRRTPTVAWQRAASTDRSSIIQQISATNKHTAQLLEHNRRRREELSSLYLASENIRLRARRIVALARVATAC